MDRFKEQFELIYDQNVEKIYRFIYLKVDSRETAEDITSRVFINGWESYRDKEGLENPVGFLYQTARNMVTDYYRQKGRSQAVSTQVLSQLADMRTDIHEKALIDSDMDQVRSAIRDLKKDYQDVIIWHYLEDMPVAEISQLLDKPAGTVRVMIHRGLKNLKDALRESA